MTIEQEKFDFEKFKFSKSEEREEARFKADLVSKRWSLFATFIPVIAIVVGLFGNVYLESVKQLNANKSTQQKIKREFVDRQLSDFYYPIQMRLEKDTAVWELAGQLSEKNRRTTGDEFSKYIENSVLIPNHDEIVSIISKNFGLIKNADEKYDPKPLIDVINQYQRHFAAYKTLRTLGLYTLNPIDVCKGCEWPQQFRKIIAMRIAELEQQREALSAQ